MQFMRRRGPRSLISRTDWFEGLGIDAMPNAIKDIKSTYFDKIIGGAVVLSGLADQRGWYISRSQLQGTSSIGTHRER
jgi:hypothetical protein